MLQHAPPITSMAPFSLNTCKHIKVHKKLFKCLKENVLCRNKWGTENAPLIVLHFYGIFFFFWHFIYTEKMSHRNTYGIQGFIHYTLSRIHFDYLFSDKALLKN